MNMKCLIGSIAAAVLLVGGFFWSLFVNPDIIGFVMIGIGILGIIGVVAGTIYQTCQKYSVKDIFNLISERF